MQKVACEANAIKKLSEIILKAKPAQNLSVTADDVSANQADRLKEVVKFLIIINARPHFRPLPPSPCLRMIIENKSSKLALSRPSSLQCPLLYLESELLPASVHEAFQEASAFSVRTSSMLGSPFLCFVYSRTTAWRSKLPQRVQSAIFSSNFHRCEKPSSNKER